jgi:hypothetical protein
MNAVLKTGLGVLGLVLSLQVSLATNKDAKFEDAQLNVSRAQLHGSGNPLRLM